MNSGGPFIDRILNQINFISPDNRIASDIRRFNFISLWPMVLFDNLSKVALVYHPVYLDFYMYVSQLCTLSFFNALNCLRCFCRVYCFFHRMFETAHVRKRVKISAKQLTIKTITTTFFLADFLLLFFSSP